MLPLYPYAIFFFLLGACIGSFLNVVVWRLPRVEIDPEMSGWGQLLAGLKALSDPPSHCPKCGNRLRWYDNIPIFGWIKLRGKCRFCRQPISIRYPIIEMLTAGLFLFYFVAYYVWQWRTCCPHPMAGAMVIDSSGQPVATTVSRWVLSESWPIFVLYVITLAGLLAASLIDAELFIIPTEIPWLIAIAAFVLHAFADRPWVPGSLNLVGDFGQPAAALSLGAAAGLAISMALWKWGVMPTSFPEGEPLLEADRAAIAEEIREAKKRGEVVDETPLPPAYSAWQIVGEMRKEILFLMPPLVLGGTCLAVTIVSPGVKNAWAGVLEYDWVSGLLGSLLGAMVGAFVVWLTRIIATLAFRRVAMGLGDVHLMFGVGAVVGAGGATIAFFLAPFFGILIAIYMLIARKGREMPLGPYLSLATAFVMLFYCPMAAYLTPGLRGMVLYLGSWFGHG